MIQFTGDRFSASTKYLYPIIEAFFDRKECGIYATKLLIRSDSLEKKLSLADTTIFKKDEVISQMTCALEERDTIVKTKESIIAQKDGRIKYLEHKVTKVKAWGWVKMALVTFGAFQLGRSIKSYEGSSQIHIRARQDPLQQYRGTGSTAHKVRRGLCR